MIKVRGSKVKIAVTSQNRVLSVKASREFLFKFAKSLHLDHEAWIKVKGHRLGSL